MLCFLLLLPMLLALPLAAIWCEPHPCCPHETGYLQWVPARRVQGAIILPAASARAAEGETRSR